MWCPQEPQSKPAASEPVTHPVDASRSSPQTIPNAPATPGHADPKAPEAPAPAAAPTRPGLSNTRNACARDGLPEACPRAPSGCPCARCVAPAEDSSPWTRVTTERLGRVLAQGPEPDLPCGCWSDAPQGWGRQFHRTDSDGLCPRGPWGTPGRDRTLCWVGGSSQGMPGRAGASGQQDAGGGHPRGAVLVPGPLGVPEEGGRCHWPGRGSASEAPGGGESRVTKVEEAACSALGSRGCSSSRGLPLCQGLPLPKQLWPGGGLERACG